MTQSSGPRGGVIRTPAGVYVGRAQGGVLSRFRRKRPRKPGGRRRRFITWKGAGLTFLAMTLLGIGLAGVAYSMVDIPSPNDLAKAEASIVYYADGKTELDRLSDVNRESVPLSQIPLTARRAVIAAEDRDFYENGGVSISGIGRAVVRTIRGQADAGGGSTITQQYVKNYFLTQDQTLSRKGKEIIISVKIDREMSKDQILENYLNTIYYGRNAYGIQTAAKAYFNKPVNEISTAEAALLATIINQPSRLDPALSPASAKVAEERWNYVLDGMVAKKWLDEGERKSMAFPKVVEYKSKKQLGGTNGYLVNAVKADLLDKGIKQEDIDRRGLRIVSTFDVKTQELAVKAVEDNRPKSGRGTGVRVGMVAIKPKDGAVLALYGGQDSVKHPFNNATQGHMQAGSTFKAFTTIAALQQGISTRIRFESGTPYRVPGEPKPVANWDHADHGQVDMSQMMAGSINTAFVRLNEKVGPDNTLKAALAAGIPPKDGEAPANTPGLASNVGNVLGSASVRPLDLANAYATIAGEGQRAKPYMVKSVAEADGRKVFETKPELNSAFSKEVAADTVNSMKSVVQAGGTAANAASLGRPAAGKTGTSSESMSAWFAGFTPEVSTAVGIELPGPDGKTPISMNGLPSLESGKMPVDVWTQFTKGILQGKPTTDLPNRAGIGDDKVYVPPPPTTSSPRPTKTTQSPSATPSTRTPSLPPSYPDDPSRPGYPRPPYDGSRPPGGGGGFPYRPPSRPGDPNNPPGLPPSDPRLPIAPPRQPWEAPQR